MSGEGAAGPGPAPSVQRAVGAVGTCFPFTLDLKWQRENSHLAS